MIVCGMHCEKELIIDANVRSGCFAKFPLFFPSGLISLKPHKKYEGYV
jgi:hypothetical protein